MSNTRVLSLVAAGALSMFSGAAFATNDPYIGPVTGFVLPATQAGPNCTSYFFVKDGGGTVQYAFNTSDGSNNLVGRVQVMNNAAFAHMVNPAFGHVKIQQAQDINYDPSLNGVGCLKAPASPGAPNSQVDLATPFLITPN